MRGELLICSRVVETGGCSPVRELQTLDRCANLLTEQRDQRQLLQAVLDVLKQDMGMVHGLIMVRSDDENQLQVELADSSAPSEHVRYRAGEGIVGEVYSRGEGMVIPRISCEPRFQDRVHRRRELGAGEMSFVCVPIRVEREVMGILSVDLPFREDRNLSELQQFLGIVAAMLAADIKARRIAAVEREKLAAENLRLRDELSEQFQPQNMVGKSGAMRRVYRQIEQVSRFETTVLIRGESGTGKELVAAAIHYSGPRRDGPLVKVNCAALSESLLESELFGHAKGAFTGAVESRIGRFEEAEGGTLFLDEIGDFSPAIQVKLLRVLQEREFQRVGSNETRRANVRVITATNRNLEEAVDAGRFRSDLYYRINVFPIVIPPLRERRGDILLLANHFVEKFAARMQKQLRRINTPAINMLMAYHWPGNVRELENCIEHAVLLAEGDVIQGHHLPPTLQMPGAEDELGGTLPARVELLERDMITDALKKTDGKIISAAKLLGVTPRILRYKVGKLRIHVNSVTTDAKPRR